MIPSDDREIIYAHYCFNFETTICKYAQPDTQGLDALMIYNTEKAMPTGTNANSQDLPLLSATKATENCETMNVVFTNNPGPSKQCLALIGSQYQSYHVHRYMRRDIHGGIKD